MQKVAGNVAVITGTGAEGIVRQWDPVLVKNGAKIIFSDMNEA